MDFRHQITTAGALAAVSVDALVLVVIGETIDAALDPVLTALLDDAIEHGDLKLKKGKTLYIHRPAGVRAARLAFAVAQDASPKALKAAAAQAIALVRGSGARHLGIGVAGAGGLDAAAAEALVTCAGEAVYTYRETKPSATPAPALKVVTVLCAKADAKAVQLGIKRGQAIAAGVALARE